MKQIENIPVQMHLRSRGAGRDLIALGCSDILIAEQSGSACTDIQSFLDKHKNQHVFFSLSYELKDSIEQLQSLNKAYIPTPLALFFRPNMVIERKNSTYSVIDDDGLLDHQSMIQVLENLDLRGKAIPVDETHKNHTDKRAYLDAVTKAKAYIQAGEIYEVNYCREYRMNNISLDPLTTFQSLVSASNAPYSAYFRFNQLHLLCASPESYLEKKGTKLVSRPIKGTRKRDRNPLVDQALKDELLNDPKERAENIMITDLVRNDLSRVALKNSVSVDELCKVYSYDTVHQMTSTISCQVPENISFIEILKASFPMGSMTGAPKIRAMAIIEDLEDFRRGWFSGSLGYLDPAGDFKSNVIIRSITYDEQLRKASYAAGGAITSLSDPEAEYKEHLLKADLMMRVLNKSIL